MKSNLFLALTLLLVPAAAQQREPIIDMHMHAQAPDSQGPPPLAMCVPASEYPSWDPASRYGDAFFGSMKKPPCSDPIWSPTTDQEMMDRTFAVMERYNIVGVLGGTPERVGTWATAIRVASSARSASAWTRRAPRPLPHFAPSTPKGD